MKTVLQREAGHGQWSSSQTRSMCAGGDTAFSVRVTLGCAVFLSKKHVTNSRNILHIFIVPDNVSVKSYLLACVCVMC